MIQIHVRDTDSGNREVWDFANNNAFFEFWSKEDIDDEKYEIQMVIYEGYCIYSGLQGCYYGNGDITFSDLRGFFA